LLEAVCREDGDLFAFDVHEILLSIRDNGRGWASFLERRLPPAERPGRRHRACKGKGVRLSPVVMPGIMSRIVSRIMPAVRPRIAMAHLRLPLCGWLHFGARIERRVGSHDRRGRGWARRRSQRRRRHNGRLTGVEDDLLRPAAGGPDADRLFNGRLGRRRL